MADALDLLTLDEAKAALNETESTRDTEIAMYNTAVSRRLDDLCGAIVKRTITAEEYPGGAAVITLRWAPVSPTATTTITSVSEYSSGSAVALTAETLVSSTGTNFSFDAVTGRLTRRSGWQDWQFAAQRVVVTYSAGRYASTATVDAKFKTAAAVMLQHVWRPGQGFGGSYSDVPLAGFAVPNAVLEILADERQPPVVA